MRLTTSTKTSCSGIARRSFSVTTVPGIVVVWCPVPCRPLQIRSIRRQPLCRTPGNRLALTSQVAGSTCCLESHAAISLPEERAGLHGRAARKFRPLTIVIPSWILTAAGEHFLALLAVHYERYRHWSLPLVRALHCSPPCSNHPAVDSTALATLKT